MEVIEQRKFSQRGEIKKIENISLARMGSKQMVSYYFQCELLVHWEVMKQGFESPHTDSLERGNTELYSFRVGIFRALSCVILVRSSRTMIL